ncbi:hypothetical protein SATRM34S_04503 [Streptomyces atroolivaceus]
MSAFPVPFPASASPGGAARGRTRRGGLEAERIEGEDGSALSRSRILEMHVRVIR